MGKWRGENTSVDLGRWFRSQHAQEEDTHPKFQIIWTGWLQGGRESSTEIWQHGSNPYNISTSKTIFSLLPLNTDLHLWVPCSEARPILDAPKNKMKRSQDNSWPTPSWAVLAAGPKLRSMRCDYNSLMQPESVVGKWKAAQRFLFFTAREIRRKINGY